MTSFQEAFVLSTKINARLLRGDNSYNVKYGNGKSQINFGDVWDLTHFLNVTCFWLFCRWFVQNRSSQVGKKLRTYPLVCSLVKGERSSRHLMEHILLFLRGRHVCSVFQMHINSLKFWYHHLLGEDFKESQKKRSGLRKGGLGVWRTLAKE